VPGPEATTLPRPIHHDSSAHRVNDFTDPTGNGQILIADGVPPQGEQPQSETDERSSGSRACLPLANADAISTISTVVSHDRDAPAERPLGGDLVASSFPLGSNAVATAMSRPPVEPDVSLQIDDDEPLAGAAPPQQEQPQSHCTESTTSRSTEVDRVLSLFGGGGVRTDSSNCYNWDPIKLSTMRMYLMWFGTP